MFEFPPHFQILLTDLHEPEENTLRVVVTEVKTLSAHAPGRFPPSSLSPIAIAADSRCLEFVWHQYVAWQVRNESFALPEEGGQFGVFVERNTSAYLRFLEETTFAASVVQKPMRHWSINCLNHCVDIVSFGEPRVGQIEPSRDVRFWSGSNWFSEAS
ncbi:hypothetical protein FBZ93_113125 [Bradyrhizobium macuxiense]|uniref:Uncharacterized protein n=1 Tax=Bradyrhizobium macuxiense TaxID=1755647 RepID=A0A560L7K8_9BRAD|nr:hypothetical protein [Bradyrhizobium macuxiense]TWB91257.1 hypothetical protein FBZ93_113125 [Bradyrhizobium macuxiense]